MVKDNLTQNEVETLISYFFNRALSASVNGEIVKVDDFYLGPDVRVLRIKDDTEYLNVVKKDDNCYTVNYSIIELEEG